MEIEVEIKKKDGTTEKYSYGDKPKRKDQDKLGGEKQI